MAGHHLPGLPSAPGSLGSPEHQAQEKARADTTMAEQFNDPALAVDGGKYLLTPSTQPDSTGKDTLGSVLDPNLPDDQKGEVYVNGMNHPDLSTVMVEAQALADKGGRPVVLVYDQALTGPSLNPITDVGYLLDLGVSGQDANSVMGNYIAARTSFSLSKEPGQESLEQILQATHGDVAIEAHSEGNLLTTCAINEAPGTSTAQISDTPLTPRPLVIFLSGRRLSAMRIPMTMFRVRTRMAPPQRSQSRRWTRISWNRRRR